MSGSLAKLCHSNGCIASLRRNTSELELQKLTLVKSAAEADCMLLTVHVDHDDSQESPDDLQTGTADQLLLTQHVHLGITQNPPAPSKIELMS